MSRPEVYRYTHALAKDEAHADLWIYDDVPEQQALISQAELEAELYGVSLRARVGRRRPPLRPQRAKVSLLLVVTARSFDRALVDELLASTAEYSVVSVAFQYESQEHMLRSAPAVESAKLASEYRLNFLRPVEAVDGRMLVPTDKIVDNMVCDTVRVKYRPTLLSTNPPPMSTDIANYFADASKVYMGHSMYHRSPSDGYFAVRSADGTGFYITATKTYKDDVDGMLERVVFVHSYDESRNSLTYSGLYLPSSDAVEAAIVMQTQEAVRSLIHTHASSAFTRNEAYRDRVLVGRERYGEPRLGRQLSEALSNTADGFLIMEDHGEVFAGRDLLLPDQIADLATLAGAST